MAAAAAAAPTTTPRVEGLAGSSGHYGYQAYKTCDKVKTMNLERLDTRQNEASSKKNHSTWIVLRKKGNVRVCLFGRRFKKPELHNIDSCWQSLFRASNQGKPLPMTGLERSLQWQLLTLVGTVLRLWFTICAHYLTIVQWEMGES